MSNASNSKSAKAQPTVGLGETLLTGPVVDQAALYGVRRSVRDVGMPLLSVVRVIPGQAEA